MPDSDEVLNKLDHSADRVESAGNLTLNLLKLIAFLVFVLIIVMIGLAVLVQKNNRSNEDTQVLVGDVQVSVRHLEAFVDALEATPEDEAARNAAISEAVRIVPEVKAILCEQFPDATACQG